MEDLTTGSARRSAFEVASPAGSDGGRGGGGGGAAAGVRSRRVRLTRVQSRVPLDAVTDEPLLERFRAAARRRSREARASAAARGPSDWVAVFLPCVVWLRAYPWREWLLPDVLAGLSVGVMVIPQGMSYATLAGLPQEYGLYGAFVPCIVYAALGSSRQLAVGPVAVTSILLANGLGDIPALQPVNDDPNDPDDPSLQSMYNTAAVQVAFFAGLLYTAVGLLRCGWITYFLSHAMVSGFMSGASIIIALSQVKYIFGISVPRAETVQDQISNLADGIDGFSWREFVMGTSLLLVLVAFRVLSRRVRRLRFLRALGPITVCVISIALMNIFKWYENPSTKSPYIKPVGDIPSGVPAFTVGWWFPVVDVSRQLLLAAIVCIIDMAESMSIAKALAQKNKYRLAATQELRGLGLANLAGAAFNCYTTTGSFSRSAVNDSTGARSQLAGAVTGVLVLATLLFLTPVFTNMSRNVQGAIIIHGVLGLFQYTEFLYLWRVSKLDWCVWVASFLATCFLGVEIGLLVGVGFSLALVVYKTAFPRIAVLGRLPGTNVYRNVAMYPDAEAPPGLVILRIDAPIFFANVEGVKDYVAERLAEGAAAAEAAGRAVRAVVIDLSPSPDIDVAGVHFLADLIEDLEKDGVSLVLANPSHQVVVMLKRARLVEKLGEGGVQVSVGDAVRHAQECLLASGAASDAEGATPKMVNGGAADAV